MTAAATLKRPSGNTRTRVKSRRVSAKKRQGLVTRIFAALPISERGWQRIVTSLILISAFSLIVVMALTLGLPAFAARQFAVAADSAGFSVKRVEVTGIDRMDRLTVYAVALDQRSRAMPEVDLDQIRDRLMQYGWIADARVSRRLPDTLVVDIVERKPAAVWQHSQQLSLIDDHGVVLEPVTAAAMPELPLVIGPDANVQATALSQLIGQTPQLKPMLAAATWVGNRRWDLRFQSGEVLALPEGEDASVRALRRFAVMDGSERLLGRGFTRFDMRDPDRMFVRVAKDQSPIDGAVHTPSSVSAGDATRDEGAHPRHTNVTKQDNQGGVA